MRAMLPAVVRYLLSYRLHPLATSPSKTVSHRHSSSSTAAAGQAVHGHGNQGHGNQGRAGMLVVPRACPGPAITNYNIAPPF